MGLTLPCAGEQVQAVTGAAEPLREFRERLRGCLTARGDALFELSDAVLCSGRPVRSLVQLSLEPEFRRGHGALYDALAAGAHRRRAAVLPARTGAAAAGGRPAGPGPGRRARRRRPRAAGPGAVRGSSRGRRPGPGRVRPLAAGAGRGRRDLLPAAGCLVLARPGARAPRRLPLQGIQQDDAGLRVPARRRHRAPAHRLGRGPRHPANCPADQDSADGRAGKERAAPPAGQRGSAAVRLRRRLQRRRAHRRAGRLPGPRSGTAGGRQRLLPGRAPSWPGKNGRPALRGPEVHCLEPEALAAAAGGRGSRAGRNRCRLRPSPTRP